MALTILERPEGRILSTTPNTANITSSYGTGDATVYKVAPHGLSDGDYIYITSDIEDYNGFWYVDSTGTYTFKIKQYPNGDYVQYIQDAEITYYVSQSGHGWSAVHLPITYRLSSDLYPTNTVDTIGGILGSNDHNGLLVLNITTPVGSTLTGYEYITLTAPNQTDISGVYQILEWVSNNVIIINLAYDDYDLLGATVQKYYNNYNAVIRVYAGISSGHEWESKKPYELASTLEIIPDENGEVFFSVNEILKAYIKTVNNPLIGTSPNNIDFWCNLYIEYAEIYDDSDGYALGTFTGSFTSDQSNFEGYAVNAMLEFKNLYSGYMSEYLMTNSTAKFLTLFAIPVIFGCSDDSPECYQDISFIKPSDVDINLRKQYYSNGVAGLSDDVIVTGDEGVYRIPIEADCEYDRVDISLIEDQALQNPNFNGLDPWTIANTSAFFNAAYSSNTIVFSFLVNGVSGTNDRLRQEFYPVIGYNYQFNYSINITNYVAGNVRLTMRFVDASGTQITVSASTDYTSNGIKTGAISLQETLQSNIDLITQVEFAVAITSSSDGNGPIVTLSSLSVDGPEIQRSEVKQFKIDCGCSRQDIRLTWLNNLGGFDYWSFTAEKDLLVEIGETGEVRKNIFPSWPKSYSSTADTIRKQTFRDTNKAYTVRSQFVTDSEIDAIAYVKSSVLVQIVKSKSDRRTVIVDNESFRVKGEGDNLYSIIFNISFTDNIPSQTA